MEKRRSKNPISSGAAALFVFPVLFLSLTAALLYYTLVPVIGVYINLAGLFIISSNEPQAARQRNLFEETGTQPLTVSYPSDTGTVYIAESSVEWPNPGDLYGKLTISGTNVDAPVYWDDSARELNAGIGTYTGGWLPGFGRTIMLAGHRDNWLKDLKSAKTGGIITIETHYGTYTYKITDTAVYDMTDGSAYDFTREDENIIIYTCYPFDFIGSAKQRYFVYGQLESGLQVNRLS